VGVVALVALARGLREIGGSRLDGRGGLDIVGGASCGRVHGPAPRLAEPAPEGDVVSPTGRPLRASPRAAGEGPQRLGWPRETGPATGSQALRRIRSAVHDDELGRAPCGAQRRGPRAQRGRQLLPARLARRAQRRPARAVRCRRPAPRRAQPPHRRRTPAGRGALFYCVGTPHRPARNGQNKSGRRAWTPRRGVDRGWGSAGARRRRTAKARSTAAESRSLALVLSAAPRRPGAESEEKKFSGWVDRQNGPR
jgi:hypothetical protein